MKNQSTKIAKIKPPEACMADGKKVIWKFQQDTIKIYNKERNINVGPSQKTNFNLPPNFIVLERITFWESFPAKYTCYDTCTTMTLVRDSENLFTLSIYAIQFQNF